MAPRHPVLAPHERRLLTIGVFLEDVEPGMSEVGFVPDSHEGPLYDLYDGDLWVGALADDDVAEASVGTAEHPVGPYRPIFAAQQREAPTR